MHAWRASTILLQLDVSSHFHKGEHRLESRQLEYATWTEPEFCILELGCSHLHRYLLGCLKGETSEEDSASATEACTCTHDFNFHAVRIQIDRHTCPYLEEPKFGSSKLDGQNQRMIMLPASTVSVMCCRGLVCNLVH